MPGECKDGNMAVVPETFISGFDREYQKSLMNRKIIGLLDRGVTVVTPTRNLARCLEFAHSRSRLDRGDSSWPSADIRDWSSWCLRNWDELQARSGEYPVVLSSQQEHSLWLQLVRESPVADGLLQVHATARQVLHAYQACKSWQIPVFPDAVYLHEDARQFRRWVRAYESMLAKNGWVDRASLPDHLARRMAAQATGAAADIAFYGFDRFTPQQRNLLGLSAANVLELGHEVRNQRVLLEVASDPRAEIRQAANWARQCLERDPGCRIGIVIANLARDRQRVDNIFARELALRQFITSDDDSLPYSISQGRPLVDYPLVRSAVHILSLMQPELQLDQLSLLLRSDFIRGYAQEQNQRARLDAELHANGEMRFDLSRLIWLMQNRYAEIPCPQLLQCLQALQEFLRQLPSRLRPGEWVIRFAGLFQVMGWPGEQSLDSHEYQTLQAWKKALDDMAGLDLVINQMDRAAACTRLSGSRPG